MMRRITAVAAMVIATSVWQLTAPSRRAISQVRVERVTAMTTDDLRAWDARVDQMTRSGDLRLVRENDDVLMPGRHHERLQQLYRGVPVFGGDVVRQTERGVTISIFGSVYEGINVSADPTLTPQDARDAIKRLSGIDVGPHDPDLLVLPLDGGTYALTYRDQVISADEASVYFIDAFTGALRLKYNLFENQSAVVQGVGVLGDTKKLSVTSVSGTYMADDLLRPPALRTYDMLGNFTAAVNTLAGVTPLSTSNLAQAPSTTWNDGANVDGHAYEGYTYDFYFKKFGRRGLDNQNGRILGLTHPVRLQDIFTAPAGVVGTYYLNAFYCPTCGSDRRGMMVYGEGAGSVVFVCGTTRFTVRNFAGSLDVVAHELTHGVTAYSSNLIYLNESGALNEAFSDMMGTSVKFFIKPASATYVMGESLTSAVTPCLSRSLQDPLAFGTPDNYSIRLTDAFDNGEVHDNSTIASHAFYLAIEGGTNRTSRLAVQGVGSANREQIEKAFYRGFTQLMPANATFSTARAVTIQAARDLYGVGSGAERAVTQAWTAVGVN
jgi:bacillolysin